MTIVHLPDSVARGSHSIALNCKGDQLLVGAPYSESTNNAGAVYVLDTKTGIVRHTLQQPCPEHDDHFGSSVAMNCDGTRVLVSAKRGFNSDATVQSPGVVYLYDIIESNNRVIQLLQTFHNPDPQDFDEFGIVVAMDQAGETIAIASPNHNHNQGVVYIFNKNGTLIRRFEPPPTTSVQEGRSVNGTNYSHEDQFFGSSISLSNDSHLLLVGAPGKGWNKQLAGVAYLFDTYTGEIIRIFQNPAHGSVLGEAATTNDDYFASTVDLNGDGSKIVVGAMLTPAPTPTDHDTLPTNQPTSGLVYVFDRNGNLVQTLTSPNSDKVNPQGVNDHFGISVSINNVGDRVLVGAPHTTENELESGANKTAIAFLFDESGKLLHAVYNPIGEPDSNNRSDTILFGGAVKLAPSGNFGAVGSAFHPAVEIACMQWNNHTCPMDIVPTEQLKPRPALSDSTMPVIVPINDDYSSDIVCLADTSTTHADPSAIRILSFFVTTFTLLVMGIGSYRRRKGRMTPADVVSTEGIGGHRIGCDTKTTDGQESAASVNLAPVTSPRATALPEIV